MNNFEFGKIIEILSEKHTTIYVLIGIVLLIIIFLASNRAGETIGKFIYYLTH